MPSGISDLTCRPRDIPPSRIVNYLDEASGSLAVGVPTAHALTQVRILARQDGIIAIQLTIDVALFDIRDLEELAYVVALVAKADLGYVHDVHRASRRRKPWFPWYHRLSSAWTYDITPSKVLIAYPIHVDPAWGQTAFTRQAFTDPELRQARCVPPPRAPQTERPRSALTSLRRRYVRVFDAMSGHLTAHRTRQTRWEKLGPLAIGSFWALVSGVAFCLIYVRVMPWNFVAEVPKALVNPGFWIGGILSPLAGYHFWYYLRQLSKWDTPRIQLLRQATIYYQYMNNMNIAVARVMNPPAEVDDFRSIIEVLRTKTEGEVHRASSHQLWLTFFLAGVGILFAALAIGLGSGPSESKEIDQAVAAALQRQFVAAQQAGPATPDVQASILPAAARAVPALPVKPPAATVAPTAEGSSPPSVARPSITAEPDPAPSTQVPVDNSKPPAGLPTPLTPPNPAV
jgi:hypothetical protein